ncbi:hypothetical protein D3C79_961970 [compost metagenome]
MDEASLPKSKASSSVRANSGVRMATAWLRRKYSMVIAGSALSTSSTWPALNRCSSLAVATPLDSNKRRSCCRSCAPTAGTSRDAPS